MTYADLNLEELHIDLANHRKHRAKHAAVLDAARGLDVYPGPLRYKDYLNSLSDLFEHLEAIELGILREISDNECELEAHNRNVRGKHWTAP